MASALTNRVLVLNAAWTLIDVTTVWRALVKVCSERAKIVDRDYALYDLEEWILSWEDAVQVSREAERRHFVGIVGGRIAAPEVIRENHYKRYHETTVRLSRRAIFERDEYRCQYCGKRFQSSELSIDHIMPRSRGGAESWFNLALACTSCNHRKGARTPKEAGMRLIRTPSEPRKTKPSWYTKLCGRQPRPRFWEDFLGDLYWDLPLEDR